MDIGTKTDLINALNEIIKTNIFHITITFVLSAIVLLLLKVVAEAGAGYIQFRLDPHLSIGSLVEVYKQKGRILRINWFSIVVETETCYVRIPTKQWRFSKMLILKEEDQKWNRRSNDEESNG